MSVLVTSIVGAFAGAAVSGVGLLAYGLNTLFSRHSYGADPSITKTLGAGALVGTVVFGAGGWIYDHREKPLYDAAKAECGIKIPNGSDVTVTVKPNGTVICSPAPK